MGRLRMCCLVCSFIVLFLFTPPLSMGGYTHELVPIGKTEMKMMVDTRSRRKLNRYQVCSLCTCCGGPAKTYCVPTPCCYAINCNIPNRPFGFCSFTPKTCNCFGCHL